MTGNWFTADIMVYYRQCEFCLAIEAACVAQFSGHTAYTGAL